jgi:hypothetical protein
MTGTRGFRENVGWAGRRVAVSSLEDDLKIEPFWDAPCFSVCAVDSREFAVAGIPGAKGVHHSPLPDPPPNAPPPFEDYGIGFTIGPRLYLIGAGGEPGHVKKEQVLGAARALYERNAKSGAAS